MNATCPHRKAYGTEASAMSVIYKLRAQGRAQIDAEKCALCGRWHIRAKKLIPEIR